MCKLHSINLMCRSARQSYVCAPSSEHVPTVQDNGGVLSSSLTLEVVQRKGQGGGGGVKVRRENLGQGQES